MSTTYDREGNEITIDRYLELIEGGGDYRRVAATTIGHVFVSTVWLGIDHSWDGHVPLIFETMIFGGPMNGWQDRYATQGKALDGHARALAAVFRANRRTTRRKLARVRRAVNLVRRYDRVHMRGPFGIQATSPGSDRDALETARRIRRAGHAGEVEALSRMEELSGQLARLRMPGV